MLKNNFLQAYRHAQLLFPSHNLLPLGDVLSAYWRYKPIRKEDYPEFYSLLKSFFSNCKINSFQTILFKFKLILKIIFFGGYLF